MRTRNCTAQVINGMGIFLARRAASDTREETVKTSITAVLRQMPAMQLDAEALRLAIGAACAAAGSVCACACGVLCCRVCAAGCARVRPTGTLRTCERA